MKIKPGSKLLFIGDSITDCARARPVGEGPEVGLGNGYVAVVDATLRAALPGHPIRVMNVGISGNTVRDLKARWSTDVIDLKPDWLSIMIGINDVWRQFDSPLRRDYVYPPEYETTLDELISQTLPGLQGLVLMTPFYIEPNRGDPMRAMMDQYGAILKRVAERHHAVFVDTQAAFDAVLSKNVYPAVLARDRVHPNLSGHMVLARAFLSGVGFTS